VTDQQQAEIDRLTAELAELTQARQHGAFTFCPQLVGHVTVAEFARKISEKRTALAQREEAVQYANEQKQRAEHAEAAITRIREVARWARRNYPGLTNLNDRLAAALDQPTPAAAAQATDEPEQCTACRPGVRCVKHCTCTECAVFQRPSGSTPQRG
jgi:uncharacterized protein (DUF3084 family)